MGFWPSWTAKADVARRATAGKRAVSFPATGLTEREGILSGCGGCPKRAAHAPCSHVSVEIPHGETRYERVAAEVRPTVASAREAQTRLWLAHWMPRGPVAREVQFNAGTGADNAWKDQLLEVTGASGGTLTVKYPEGGNPKRQAVGTSRANPAWPFEDPATGQTGAIVSETGWTRIPPGAVVEFLEPSVLAGKIRPLVVGVNPPASGAVDYAGTFSLDLANDVRNAREPLDLAFPPEDGKYYCRVVWETDPGLWLNVQGPKETQFARGELEVTSAGVVELLDNAGNSTRVLFPDMGAGVFVVRVFYSNGTVAVLSEAQARARLETTQTGASSWETFLDVADLDFGGTVERVLVSYMPEAVAADSPRWLVQGSCSHAQEDPSDSYNTNGGRHCVRPEASAWGDFVANCWKPSECDSFALGDESNATGAAGWMPSDYGRGDFLPALWTRADWVLEQQRAGLSGARAFRLFKPAGGGASIEALCGSWRDVVPAGIFATREEFRGPIYGKRIEWTEGGETFHGLAFGAFFLAAHDLGDGYAWNAAATPTAGTVAESVAGWTTKEDALGNALPTALALFPWRWGARTNVYTYQTGSAADGVTAGQASAFEVFAVAVDLDLEDAATVARVAELVT